MLWTDRGRTQDDDGDDGTRRREGHRRRDGRRDGRLDGRTDRGRRRRRRDGWDNIYIYIYIYIYLFITIIYLHIRLLNFRYTIGTNTLLSQRASHKTTFPDTHRFFPPAVGLSKKFPIVCVGQELKKDNL